MIPGVRIGIFAEIRDLVVELFAFLYIFGPPPPPEMLDFDLQTRYKSLKSNFNSMRGDLGVPGSVLARQVS